jgi:hypothetical protein
MDIQFRNLGTVNKNKIDINGLEIWFSYETPVALRRAGVIVCRQNDWSNTTGKLLNHIEPDKTKRVTGEVFEKLLEQNLNALPQ